MTDTPDDETTAKPRRHTRRLADHILIAFHQACDQDLEVAMGLLEVMVATPRLPGALGTGDAKRNPGRSARTALGPSTPRTGRVLSLNACGCSPQRCSCWASR
jgi:hypothetical protein